VTLSAANVYGAAWPHHGKTNGYRLGCRCAECREAKRQSNVREVQRQRICEDCSGEFVYEHGLTGRKRCGSCNNPGRLARRAEIERSQRPRVCARCGTAYFYSRESAHGHKYCGQCLILSKWETTHKVLALVCPSCGAKHEHQNKQQLCADCYSMLPASLWQTMWRHHVDIERSLEVAANPTCEICGDDLTRMLPDAKRRLRPVHAVDHDHECCPAGRSCGKCVRGVICRRCNIAIGYLRDDSEFARRCAIYLNKWKSNSETLRGIEAS
jgi:hypothetical protein